MIDAVQLKPECGHVFSAHNLVMAYHFNKESRLDQTSCFSDTTYEHHEYKMQLGEGAVRRRVLGIVSAGRRASLGEASLPQIMTPSALVADSKLPTWILTIGRHFW